MSDMPEKVNLQMESGPEELRTLCFCDEGEGVEYTRSDLLNDAILKAAFVDKMCKALGVTFEVLVSDHSVKAALREVPE